MGFKARSPFVMVLKRKGLSNCIIYPPLTSIIQDNSSLPKSLITYSKAFYQVVEMSYQHFLAKNLRIHAQPLTSMHNSQLI